MISLTTAALTTLIFNVGVIEYTYKDIEEQFLQSLETVPGLNALEAKSRTEVVEAAAAYHANFICGIPRMPFNKVTSLMGISNHVTIGTRSLSEFAQSGLMILGLFATISPGDQKKHVCQLASNLATGKVVYKPHYSTR